MTTHVQPSICGPLFVTVCMPSQVPPLLFSTIELGTLSEGAPGVLVAVLVAAALGCGVSDAVAPGSAVFVGAGVEVGVPGPVVVVGASVSVGVLPWLAVGLRPPEGKTPIA